jgi:single-strand DNA-binding protein
MNNVLVIQGHAHPAGAVKLEFVKGREGQLARAVLSAISNQYRGRDEEREECSIALRWTLWGQQAEHAAECLGKGSHVNLVGRLHNTQYHDSEGREVRGMEFQSQAVCGLRRPCLGLAQAKYLDRSRLPSASPCHRCGIFSARASSRQA